MENEVDTLRHELERQEMEFQRITFLAQAAQARRRLENKQIHDFARETMAQLEPLLDGFASRVADRDAYIRAKRASGWSNSRIARGLGDVYHYSWVLAYRIKHGID